MFIFQLFAKWYCIRILNKTKCLIVCMLFLLCSILIHCIINSNYFNITLDIEKCPFCYGNNICEEFEKNSISFLNLSLIERFLNLFNVKNVYIAHYKNKKVILKKLAHNSELAKIDYKICENQSNPESCPPYPKSYSLDFTTNIVEYMENNENKLINFKICNKSTLIHFVNHLFSLQTHLNVSTMTANLWTTLLANVEPLILQIFNANDNNWPVSKYYGACGRVIVEEYCGKALHAVEDEPWLKRADLAVQLLKAADDFTNKHPVFRFYLTDISSDNIVVTDDFQIKFIDLENIIINDKQSSKGLGIHESEKYDCDDCYAFSPNEICSYSISDHNFYSVCKLLLSKSAMWPMMKNGLLHSPPNAIFQKYSNVFNYIEICSNSSKTMNRFSASKKIVEILETIIQKERQL